VKSVYHIVALLAILHLVVLAGLTAYLAGTGRLNGDKIEKIAAVRRGEDLQVAPRSTTSQPVVLPVLAQASSEKIAGERMGDDVKRLVGERLLREAADRKALVDAAMLKVTRQLEDLSKEQAQLAEARKRAREEDESSGQQAELEIVAGLGEKTARDVLMKKPIPDVVNMMMKMKRRNASAIIEACKTEAERAWADKVLAEIANRDEGQASELAKASR
jgi:hypothetical protein